MIKLSKPQYGWMWLAINKRDFCVSYLNDIKEDLNYLFGVDEEYKYECEVESRAIFLDGEGTDLKLSIVKYEFEKNFAITWWKDDEKPIAMMFDYEEFKQEYLEEMNKWNDVYERDFLMECNEEEDGGIE